MSLERREKDTVYAPVLRILIDLLPSLADKVLTVVRGGGHGGGWGGGLTEGEQVLFDEFGVPFAS
jgi:hypothetical protein